MIVLGIDPGSIVTGFGLVNFQYKEEYLTSGTIKLKGTLSQRLHVLYQDLHVICNDFKPQVFVVEGVFAKINWSSTLILSQVRGVILLVAEQFACELIEIQPRYVKKTITGNGAASKNLVATIVSKRLNISNPISLDASDALALALTYTQRARFSV